MSVKGKVVVITGTSSGIGRTVAEVFAERGALVVGCARREDKGLAVEKRIREAGGEFTFIKADLTVRDEAFAVIDAAVEKHGKIDILINNAGGSLWSRTEDVSEADFTKVVQLNLYAPLFCSQRAIKHMKLSGGGLILSIASVAGVIAQSYSASYNAAKSALIHLSRTIAVEYLDDGIRSNVIIMGGAPTADSGNAIKQITKMLKGEDAQPNWEQKLPTPLSGTPLHEIAAALIALSGDDAKAINGGLIPIDQAQSAGSLYSEAMLHALSGGWNDH